MGESLLSFLDVNLRLFLILWFVILMLFFIGVDGIVSGVILMIFIIDFFFRIFFNDLRFEGFVFIEFLLGFLKDNL